MSYERGDYIANIVGVFIIIFVIQAVLFSFLYNVGILFVFGLLFYIMFFIYRDRRMRREELNKILYYKKPHMIYNRKLPTEIP